MSIPDAAIEAAAEVLAEQSNRLYPDGLRAQAKYAIRAAMPAIREHIAQEIEAMPRFDGTGYVIDKYDAARIVRGG